MVKSTSVIDLNDLLSKDNVNLIDVREPFEFKEAFINGAKLIPLGTFKAENIPKSSKLLVIQCRSGRRSAEACRRIIDFDPDREVYNLEGGILAWQEAGFKVEKETVSKKRFSIMQQVHITAGSIVFAGTSLGFFVSTKFYILPAVVGAGLFYAGISGSCLMAKLLSKMSWNK